MNRVSHNKQIKNTATRIIVLAVNISLKWYSIYKVVYKLEVDVEEVFFNVQATIK